MNILLLVAIGIMGFVIKELRDEHKISARRLKGVANYAIAMLLDDLDRPFQKASFIKAVRQAKPQDEEPLAEYMVEYICDLAKRQGFETSKYWREKLWKIKQGEEPR